MQANVYSWEEVCLLPIVLIQTDRDTVTDGRKDQKYGIFIVEE